MAAWLAGCALLPALVLAAEPVTVQLMPFADQRGSALPRLLDLADVAYDARWCRSPQPPMVFQVSYDPAPADARFRATVTAHGLRPNACYQLKLMGRPGTPSGRGLWPDGEPKINDWLGRHGRWWDFARERTVDNFANDVEARHLTPAQRGWVAGYIFFAGLVTDEYGAVGPMPVVADHSWHITGRTGQESQLNREPGTDRQVSLRRRPPAYSPMASSGSATLWMEAERDDPPELPLLPPGRHDLVLLVTEETFHAETAAGGGWRSVLVSDWPTTTSPHSGRPWVTQRGAPIQVTVAPRAADPPTVWLRLPRPGDAVYGETLVQVSAEAWDNAAVTVECAVDGGAWEPLDLNEETGYFEAMPSLPGDQAHRIAVRARDAEGRQTVLPDRVFAQPR